jgi:hypothetical protein
MTTYRSRSAGINLPNLFRNSRMSRGATWGLMILGALLAFEIFNYSTTEFALNDVLGDLRFAGIRWATILSLAFCGIDFAGIARLFTPEQGRDEPAEVWYLFGAWLLAAAMNAMLTWWGVSVAIVNHTSLGSAVMSSATITKVVPVFVAVMVWLIRVLIIGTFSLAGERLFSQSSQQRRSNNTNTYHPATNTRKSTSTATLRPASSLSRPASSFNPAPKPARSESNYSHQEPTYHNLTFGARSDQSEHRYKA